MADALDLGSSPPQRIGVQIPSLAPINLSGTNKCERGLIRVSENQIDVKIEEISPVKKKLLFDVSWMEVRKELDEVYRDVGKKAKVKGFRQGKVPRKILNPCTKIMLRKKRYPIL